MTEREEQINIVETKLADAKEYLEFAGSEERLSVNPDFKTLIMEGYFKEEAARLAGLLADPSMADDINQREINSQLKALGHLRQYLMNVRRTRGMLQAAIGENQDLLDDLREES